MPEVETELGQIGRAIARERRYRLWSQDYLAEAAGVSRLTILRLEKGEVKSTVVLLAVLGVLDISLGLYAPGHVHEWEQRCRVCGTVRE